MVRGAFPGVLSSGIRSARPGPRAPCPAARIPGGGVLGGTTGAERADLRAWMQAVRQVYSVFGAFQVNSNTLSNFGLLTVVRDFPNGLNISVHGDGVLRFDWRSKVVDVFGGVPDLLDVQDA